MEMGLIVFDWNIYEPFSNKSFTIGLPIPSRSTSSSGKVHSLFKGQPNPHELPTSAVPQVRV
jgi:hypothetical protein